MADFDSDVNSEHFVLPIKELTLFNSNNIRIIILFNNSEQQYRSQIVLFNPLNVPVILSIISTILMKKKQVKRVRNFAPKR